MKENVLDNKCPSCNASIPFNPTVGKWKCEYCGGEFTLEEIEKNNQKKEDNKTAKPDNYNNYDSYKCKNCGAEIVADADTVATFCVYCGNTAIIKEKLSNEFKPNEIIPFKTTKEKAIDAFKNINKGKPFVPKDFNSPKNIEKIRGVYIPFWIYDVNMDAEIKCSANRITKWSQGDTHYTKTDTYNVERAGTMSFIKVPVDGSTHFDNDIMNSIEPFDYKDLTSYNHAYLSGFLAEKYDVDSESAFTDAKSRCEKSSQDILFNDIKGYSTKVILNKNISLIDKSSRYVLLPVYMVNVSYNNKMYIFAMNGQTGKFIGNIPLDKKKVVIYSILIFIISLLICIIASYIIFKVGGK